MRKLTTAALLLCSLVSSAWAQGSYPGTPGPGQIIGNYTSAAKPGSPVNPTYAATSCPSWLTPYQLFANTTGAPTNTLIAIWDGAQCVTLGALNQTAHTIVVGTIPYPVTSGGTGQTSFTANLPLIGNGTSALGQGTLAGSTTKFATVNGSITNGHCRSTDSLGNDIDAGGPCTTSGGGGTVTAGIAGQVAYYSATGATVVGTSTQPINIKRAPYNALGTSIQVQGNVTIASGSPNLSISGGNTFTSSQQGDLIQIPGAGTAGGDLITTILTYNSSTSVTLATNAITAISGTNTKMQVGPDDTTAISSAITAACVSGAVHSIYVPTGYYLTQGGFTIPCSLTIHGDGMMGAITAPNIFGITSQFDGNYISTIADVNNANYLFTIRGENVEIRDINLWVTSTTPTSGGVVNVTNSAARTAQRVNYDRVLFAGGYDNVDQSVGQWWHVSHSEFLYAQRYNLFVQNTLCGDCGGQSIDFNSFYTSGPTQTAAMYWSGSGGGRIVGNKVYGNGTTTYGFQFVNGNSNSTSELLITNNNIEVTNGCNISITNWTAFIISNNFLGPPANSNTPLICTGGGDQFFKIDVGGATYLQRYYYVVDDGTSVHGQISRAEDQFFSDGMLPSIISGFNLNNFIIDDTIGPPNGYLGPVDPRVPGTQIAVPTNNSALASYFQVNRTVQVTGVAVDTGTASGNIDVGIYDATTGITIGTFGGGPNNVTGVKKFGLTGTNCCTLFPGHTYYLVIAEDNTTGTFLGLTQATSLDCTANFGGLPQTISIASYYPLPTSTTVFPPASGTTCSAKTPMLLTGP